MQIRKKTTKNLKNKIKKKEKLYTFYHEMGVNEWVERKQREKTIGVRKRIENDSTKGKNSTVLLYWPYSLQYLQVHHHRHRTWKWPSCCCVFLVDTPPCCLQRLIPKYTHLTSLREAVLAGDGTQLEECCLACTKPWILSPAPHKSIMVVHTCNLSTWEVKAGLEIQNYPWLYSKFEVSLSYYQTLSKNNKNENKIKTFAGSGDARL